MDEPYPELDFERSVEEAIESLPDDLRDSMSNLELVIEDEPPPGMPLLGLYQGVPLTRRSSWYGAVPPDRRVVLHEIAHHFGISDERLRELDRY